MIEFLCECFGLCLACLQYNNNNSSHYNMIENKSNNTNNTEVQTS